MARKKGNRINVNSSPVITSWDEVDENIKQYGFLEMQKEELEIEMNREITAIKEECKDKVKQLEVRMKLISMQLEQFGKEQKPSFSKNKTRKLNFGECGFRKHTKITVVTKKLKDIIGKLKDLKMTDCINTKETVNKETLKQYNDETLKNIGGIKRTVEDKFWFLADRERIRSCQN